MVKLTRPVLTFLLILGVSLWSLGIGWGISHALGESRTTSSTELLSQATSSKPTPKPKTSPSPSSKSKPKANSSVSPKSSPQPAPKSTPSPSPKPSSTTPETVPSPAPSADIPSFKPVAVDPTKPLFVDSVPTRYEPGFQAYLETCASCHIAIPPEVLPVESWQEILRKPDNHFGTSIPNFNRFTQLLIWDYVSTFSRPSPPDSPRILYVEKSRYFKALHPRVTMPSEMSAKTCVVCHPNVANANFRTLTPEWNDAP